MTIRGVALTKYPCIVEACLDWGGGVGGNSIPWSKQVSIPYELANSCTKILDGIHQESKRFPSEKVTDLRKTRIFFQNPGVLYVFNTSVLFSKSARKKMRPDYSYFNFEKQDSFFRIRLEKKIHLDYFYLELFSAWNFWTLIELTMTRSMKSRAYLKYPTLRCWLYCMFHSFQ